jgi:hypothetical protein
MVKGRSLAVISLGLAQIAAAPAFAGDWRNGDVAVSVYTLAEPASASTSYGRPNQLGLASVAPPLQTPILTSSVMDCSSEPLVGGSSSTQSLIQPFACYAQPQWPSSGTPESFEEGQRRRFDGQ